MIISDLKHIESATETKVQGGGGRWRPWRPSYQGYKFSGSASSYHEAF